MIIRVLYNNKNKIQIEIAKKKEIKLIIKI